jgi:hypothetical protein
MPKRTSSAPLATAVQPMIRENRFIFRISPAFYTDGPPEATSRQEGDRMIPG